MNKSDLAYFYGLGNSLREKFQVTVHKTTMMHDSSPNYLTEEPLGHRLRKSPSCALRLSNHNLN